MSIFNTSSLTESAENELKLQIDADASGIAAKLAAEFGQIETLEKNVFEYSAPMIPIIQKPTNEGTKFLVEYDMLNCLSRDTKTDILGAFKSLCEANSIEDQNDLFVYLRGPLFKVLTNVNESDIGLARKALENIRSLKEAGINLVRDEDPLDSNEPQAIEADEIPTDPNDDTITTVQDIENQDDVRDLERRSRAISAE